MRRFWLAVFIIVNCWKLSDGQVPDCKPRDQLEKFGERYVGSKSRSVSGAACMQWSEAAYFADEDDNSEFYEFEHAFCRGFKYEKYHTYGPWCYIAANNMNHMQWEPCFSACEDINKTCVRFREIPISLEGYTGKKSTTKSNRPCTDWRRFQPDDKINKTGPEVTFLNHNYCRSLPLKTVPYHEAPKSPWCFTDESGDRWEECFEKCHDIAECMDRTETTLPYKGRKDVTINGRYCQPWVGTNHSMSNKFPMATVSDASYCRNFGAIAAGPFCLTNPSRDGVLIEPCFEHCDDLTKKPCVGSDKLVEYWGSVRKTRNGRLCQRWDKQTPHAHNFTVKDLNVDEMWEVSNFCRNPDASLDGPWCFTLDMIPKREQCFSKCTAADEELPRVNESLIPKYEPKEFAIVEEGGGYAYIWIALVVVMTFFVILVVCDLALRNFCLSKAELKRNLAENEKIIETFRPGRDGRPITQQQVDNWTKVRLTYAM